MSTARAALVDANGLVDTVIVVDLDGTYEPPDGLTVHVLAEDSMVGPGWCLVDGTFAPPEQEPAGPVLPSVLDLQAQLDDLADFIATTL